MASDYTVRPAKKDDMLHVANMIQELADFEEMPNGPKLTAGDLLRDAFESNPPYFKCKVVQENSCSEYLGYAIYFNTYSTWEGKSMMIEDLYVKQSQRKRGIGDALLQSVAKEAVETGCSRLDLHVLKWNPAREFYEKRGAQNLTETEDWFYYRFGGDHLKNFASKV